MGDSGSTKTALDATEVKKVEMTAEEKKEEEKRKKNLRKLREQASNIAEEFIKEYGFSGFNGYLVPLDSCTASVSFWKLKVSAGTYSISEERPDLYNMCAIYVNAPKEAPAIRVTAQSSENAQSNVIKSFFPESQSEGDYERECKRMLTGFTKLRHHLSELSPAVFDCYKRDIESTIKLQKTTGIDRCVDDWLNNPLLVGTLWKGGTKNPVGATVGSFQLQKNYETAFINLPSDVSNDLLCIILGATQAMSVEIPIVKFPGKSSSEMCAQTLHYFYNEHISPIARVDVIMAGHRDVGKTTIVKNLSNEQWKKFPTTNWYDAYAHAFHYTPDEIMSYRAAGESMDFLDPSLSLIIWDMGGQSSFWGLTAGRSLPLDLFPQIGKRVPHVIVLSYSADDPKSLDELRTDARLLQEHLGPGVYDSPITYKMLFRTKIDIPGTELLSDDQMKTIAAEFGAEAYAQINALADRDTIVNMIKRGCAFSYNRYELNESRKRDAPKSSTR